MVTSIAQAETYMYAAMARHLNRNNQVKQVAACLKIHLHLHPQQEVEYAVITLSMRLRSSFLSYLHA